MLQILVLIITALISAITTSVLSLDLISKILYILAVLLGLIILAFLLYARKFIRDLDELRISDYIAQDITILNFEKNVCFNENSRENGAHNEEIRIIRNNMQHNFNLYKFNNSLECDPPTFSIFEFCKDGKKMNYTEEDVKFHCGDQNDHQDNLNRNFELKFPVHAPPNETRDIRLKYTLKNFAPALNGDVDWIQLGINAVTEKLRISVTLDGELKKTHMVTSPIRPGTTGDILDIEIRDFSDERMWSSELMYKNKNIVPAWKDDKMEWIIYRPKIGYKYRVYFTIKPKESSGGICSFLST